MYLFINWLFIYLFIYVFTYLFIHLSIYYSFIHPINQSLCGVMYFWGEFHEEQYAPLFFTFIA